ncbi:MAG: TonB-dependent receptor [Acidobacteriaceae bacterium]|nr:TonB-dependent receptor [Acidobacteriaceae bacterium]
MLTVRPVRGCVLLLILVAATSWSQLNTGSIAGAVKDPSGAVVPNAQVTLTDAAKGFTYTAVTDSNGFFTIRSLPAATYTERVEAPGFSPYERPNIVLNVGSALNADVSLSVATAGQTVTVNEAGGSLLQTEDAVTGQTLDRTFINNLPLIGRQVFDLAFLAPGVAPATGQAYGAGSSAGNNFVSNGSRNAQADILIDGVSTTNYEQNSGFVVPLFTPSVDAVQEFRVEQSNFSAQYGFTGGTVINVVTRSGTNQFHGSAYEFWRNDILNANSFFNNISGTPRQKYRWNDFGGTFGGPIKKDRIFFSEITKDNARSPPAPVFRACRHRRSAPAISASFVRGPAALLMPAGSARYNPASYMIPTPIWSSIREARFAQPQFRSIIWQPMRARPMVPRQV